MEIRDSKDVIKDIKELVNSKGYIYALCLIIMDDFHFIAEKMHEVNYRERLNKNEVSLLLGIMIQNPIKLTKPESPFDLLELKKKTYSIMEELQASTSKPMFDKFRNLFENPNSEKYGDRKFFFGGENSFIEPIFYSGDGIYDFQYLEYLKKKYKYDKAWLEENKSFNFEETVEIVSKIKLLHQEKISRINFLGVKENKEEILSDLKKDKSIPKKGRKKRIDEIISMLEFYQYFKLFDTEHHIENRLLPEQITEEGWNSFYNGLLDLFCIYTSDFNSDLNTEGFLNNFSISYNSVGINKQFKNIGDFNLFAAKPIIEIEEGRYFVPISFSVFEAVYESPYYWMVDDKEYKDKLSYNRGKVGEEITYELLASVFGESRVFQSVRIESKKGFDDSDIDVLCVLGSKALCVQVKSKKLTQLSRKGSFDQLQKDFKGAVQAAYQQGIVCRERILENTASFYNYEGEKIELSEDIEEVYILGVTTENYPALTHQTFILLEKEDDQPNPLFLTIFDLELVAFYLENPYDFLYYIRQRIDLMEYFKADEEIHFLGYHLMHKLFKNPDADYEMIDSSVGQLIDRNYYPYKSGVELSLKNDRIKNRWKNKDFEVLCEQLAKLKTPKVTDVIFHLLDWSEQSRDNLVRQIKETKRRSRNNNSRQSFAMVPGPERSSFGLSFISWENNNMDELMNMLLTYSEIRKYKSKADHWVGIGCLRDSDNYVDGLVFNNSEWKYDEMLEVEAKNLLGNKSKFIRTGKKVGRNDRCPCNSGEKYKRCCGRLS